jgi:hypothetical protein
LLYVAYIAEMRFMLIRLKIEKWEIITSSPTTSAVSAHTGAHVLFLLFVFFGSIFILYYYHTISLVILF